MSTPSGDNASEVFDVGFTERLPAWENFVLAVQNILGMTGMFLFPGILGASFHLSPTVIAELYGATFVTCGLVTILQGVFLLRLPIIMGPWAATFAALIAGGHEAGLGVAFGSMFVAAVIWSIISLPIGSGAVIGYLARLFKDPIVYAGILLITMTFLSDIALAGWVGSPAQAGFGVANWVGGGVCVAVIIGCIVFTKGIVRRGAMLWGIIVGAAVYALFTPLSAARLASAPWVYVPSFFHFGFGVNGPLVVLFFLMLMSGAISALSQYHMVAAWGKEDVGNRRMSAGIFTESLGAVVAAVVGGFSTNSYPDCLAILKTSRVGSVLVTVSAGVILLIVGFILKFDMLFVVIPSNVIAAAATLMFGIVLVSSVEMLGRVNWDPINSVIIGLSFMFSVGGLFINAQSMKAFPQMARMIFAQPILTGSVLIVVLHVVLNGWVRPAQDRKRQALSQGGGGSVPVS